VAEHFEDFTGAGCLAKSVPADLDHISDPWGTALLCCSHHGVSNR
jgi:hypothetical protein